MGECAGNREPKEATINHELPFTLATYLVSGSAVAVGIDRTRPARVGHVRFGWKCRSALRQGWLRRSRPSAGEGEVRRGRQSCR